MMIQEYMTQRRIFFVCMVALLFAPALLIGSEAPLREHATPLDIVSTYARTGDEVTIVAKVVEVNNDEQQFHVKGAEGAVMPVSVVGSTGVVQGDMVIISGTIKHDAYGKYIKARDVYLTDNIAL